MKFRVIGASRETGARMTLEFEAESKAAAERKATQSGMSVNRVEDITDGSVAHAMEPRASGRRSGGGGGKLLLLVIVVVIAVAIWHFWPQVQRIIHR
ncbi:MAG TPA: hypothetical protein VIM11_06495 [Tepidisphaeraceae bacterium]|jgi:hypothetical protein